MTAIYASIAAEKRFTEREAIMGARIEIKYCTA
jgi:hypothetical protein